MFGHRYDKDHLKDTLTVDDIIKLLNELGVDNIINERETKGQLITNTICHDNSGTSSQKLYYYIDSKTFHCYTECSCSFDIYELVRRSYEAKGIELHFSSCVDWVARKSGKSFGFGFGIDLPEKKPIDSEWEWMNRFNRKKIVIQEPKEYSDRILDVFSKVYHPEFLKDNINEEVMDFFEISYYNRDSRITIPHRHWKTGKIIGIKGRAIRQEDIDNGFKYLPLMIQGKLFNHSNYSNLYGLWQNKEAIKRLKKVIIFESEKSVLQCASYFGINNNFSVALSGRNISQYQIDIILGLGVNKVILAMDKEYNTVDKSPKVKKQLEREIEFILRMGRRFSPYVQTYTLFDKHNLLGYKESPSDRGKDILVSLMASKQEILNKD
ncbi:hypothetical protein [Siminovitchia sp. 179-K 8D1 HS]|uniref:hypothetical protein n=1 Tax=Siminovitchia sp. 179-K 8D1 HS TaxID=3142385 RepID=UPI0039A00865